mmetsp:Transcript_39284/g.89244  ORF Transcript_39284/g.89244 Transcript_39284/m.89244 type:complete len:126 (+) Transcript_39284:141-518(+)
MSFAVCVNVLDRHASTAVYEYAVHGQERACQLNGRTNCSELAACQLKYACIHRTCLHMVRCGGWCGMDEPSGVSTCVHFASAAAMFVNHGGIAEVLSAELFVASRRTTPRSTVIPLRPLDGLFQP